MPPASEEDEKKIMRTRTELAAKARGSHEDLIYKDVQFAQLSSDMPLKPRAKYACCGSVREAILIDMKGEGLKRFFDACFYSELQELAATQVQHSEEEPKFLCDTSNNTLEKLMGFLPNPDRPHSVLVHTVNYVNKNTSVPKTPAALEEKIAATVNELGRKNMIPLELLIQNKLGQCRHQALLTGYLLSTFLNNLYPDNNIKIFRFRTNLIELKTDATSMFQPRRVPHAVTIYQDDSHLFLLDATRRNTYAKNGLVMNLIHLDAGRRKLLQACYPSFDIQHFVKEIFTHYPMPRIEPSSINSSYAL